MQKNEMCVYKIPEAPYIAVANVKRKLNDHVCCIENHEGNIQTVVPLYMGPFDSDKFLKYGSLMLKYVGEVKDIQKKLVVESCKIFNIDPFWVGVS